MHAHACIINPMRTTVEMKPEHRSALLALAAKKGEKGFSSVLAEAIEEYLDGERERAKQRDALLALRGSLSDEEAEELRKYTSELRKHWR